MTCERYGQVDAILGSVTGEAFLNGCKWSGSAKYRAAPRGVWHVTNSTDVGGFARCVDNLVQVVVRGAGHFVPADQPQRVRAQGTKWCFCWSEVCHTHSLLFVCCYNTITFASGVRPNHAVH